jgi:23S rRNA (uracil747-C5)-methyltransferase
VQCAYYDTARCRSCTLLDRPYDAQLAAKERRCRDLIVGPGLDWLPTVRSADAGFRNKAKMVVGGTVDAPTLGLLDSTAAGVDLRDCPLYPPSTRESLAALAAFIPRARVVPYDVAHRTGELKYLLVTESPDGDLMVRFVLRSQESVARLRKHLPTLRRDLPRLAVASANLQPEHKAVLEGVREIPLTERQSLPMRLNGIELHVRPRSFFQTNTDVAAALYRQVRDWVGELAPTSVWDLYCGVGAFALHCAAPGRDVLGVETSVEAVESARTSARAAGFGGARFAVDDATAFALRAPVAPDLVIVNPPRRGLGPDLCRWLEASGIRHVVYSSCDAQSLARDLRRMPSLAPRRARILDMFPHTWHHEVVTLLERG